jgi:hypothetical protein
MIEWVLSGSLTCPLLQSYDLLWVQLETQVSHGGWGFFACTRTKWHRFREVVMLVFSAVMCQKHAC